MKNSKIFNSLKPYLSIFLLFTILIFTLGFESKCNSDETEKEKKSKKSKGKSNEIKISTSSESKESDSEVKEKGVEHPEEESEDKESKSHKATSKDKEKDKHPEKEEKPSISAKVIWDDLMSGNKRFISGQHTNGNYVSSRKKLVDGQNPNVIVIGCADSRVPPELIFDKNLGELFVIRTAGNIADPIALGSIEYAAEHLHSKLLVVLGHESCGAVGAALSKDIMPTANLRAIVDTIRPSFKSEELCKIGSDNNIKCVELNAVYSGKSIVSRSPILKELIEKNKISVIEAIYSLKTGQVEKIN